MADDESDASYSDNHIVPFTARMLKFRADLEDEWMAEGNANNAARWAATIAQPTATVLGDRDYLSRLPTELLVLIVRNCADRQTSLNLVEACPVAFRSISRQMVACYWDKKHYYKLYKELFVYPTTPFQGSTDVIVNRILFGQRKIEDVARMEKIVAECPNLIDKLRRSFRLLQLEREITANERHEIATWYKFQDIVSLTKGSLSTRINATEEVLVCNWRIWLPHDSRAHFYIKYTEDYMKLLM